MTEREHAVNISELRTILAHGTSRADGGDLRLTLGLDPGCEDKLFAQALVRVVAAEALPELPEAISGRPSSAASDTGPVTASRSFLMRATLVTPTPGLSIARLDDIRTLLLVVQAGTLFQRREAVRRIGERLQSDAAIPSEWRKQAIEKLSGMHQAELAHEIGLVLARLPGSDGRSARAEQRARSERAEQVGVRIAAYWDGEESMEPVLRLNAEERAQLLARLRGLPDLLARHVAALVEDANNLGQAPRLRVLLGALQHTGDPRLFPALRSLLSSQDPETFEPCVRAIGSIEDPRVTPLLIDAYEHTARPRERLVLLAALGGQGDARGLAYVRETLAAGDPALLVLALEALAELGSGEDIQRVVELLEHADSEVVSAAIATLGRIGDGRSLVPLSTLRSRVQRSALRARIEDAETAIGARVELLGEEAPSQQAKNVAVDTNKMVARVRARDPATVRVRARLYHLFAYVWLVLGAPLRAIARFEAASTLRPGWIAPVLALSLLYTRREQTPQALATFRRAVDIDRGAVEADDGAVTAMAQTFLRRAEAMEHEGRLDIARSLVEEVLGYDLRRAAAEVRFALQERLELQISRERGWKP
jgi:HEAT repeat protein